MSPLQVERSVFTVWSSMEYVAKREIEMAISIALCNHKSAQKKS